MHCRGSRPDKPSIFACLEFSVRHLCRMKQAMLWLILLITPLLAMKTIPSQIERLQEAKKHYRGEHHRPNGRLDVEQHGGGAHTGKSDAEPGDRHREGRPWTRGVGRQLGVLDDQGTTFILSTKQGLETKVRVPRSPPPNRRSLTI